MKISYRTHPVLEKLAKKDIGNYCCFECDRDWVVANRQLISDKWKSVSLGINNEIYILSQAFVDAYELAGDKLYNSHLWGDIEETNICLIAPAYKNPPHKETTCLKIRRPYKDKPIITVELFGFIDNAIIHVGDVFISYHPNKHPDFVNYGWKSTNMGNIEKHILNCLLITLFIKYADVQIKNLSAKSSIKDIDCKYVNDTKMPVRLLDSTWFTTLVKSDGFDVRGHFRLQPKKKNGEWTKEIVWIHPFKKSGYTRKAGVLSHLNEDK